MVSAAHDPRLPVQTVGRPRFEIGRFDGHEDVRIPAAWPGWGGVTGLVVALPLWIFAAFFKFGAKIAFSGWTGLLVVLAIATFIFVAYAMLQIIWWLGGAERIAVIGPDLLVRHTMFGLPIMTRSYRGEDIQFLDATDVPRPGWLEEPMLPFASSGRCGNIKFFYRESTVYLGHDLGPAGGKDVAAWLTQRLPASGINDRR